MNNITALHVADCQKAGRIDLAASLFELATKNMNDDQYNMFLAEIHSIIMYDYPKLEIGTVYH